jgi:hypothetical protein
MATAMSFGTPNFSGLLFRKGVEETPFSTMIGANPRTVNHVEFVTGQYYTAIQGSQPSISESDSLTAPEAVVHTRSQLINVTQIFQERVSVSYAKESNMGQMDGVNIASQLANPQSELNFQIQRAMAKIAQDIEYTFINGVYNRATNDTEVNKSRGILTAITTNDIDAGGAEMNRDLISKALMAIAQAGGDINNIVVGMPAIHLAQLDYDANKNGMTAVDRTRNVNGLMIQTVLTPFGAVGVQLMETIPVGTALVFNPSIMRPMEQPTPNKGNFFIEQLAKAGAGENYQIFGQIGLDHGCEWLSAKITGLSEDFPEDPVVSG